MNKLSIITFFFLLFFQNSTLFAQSISCDTTRAFFQRKLEITPGFEAVRRMKQTPDGGWMLLGNYRDNVLGLNGMVAKLNSVGEIQWAKQIGKTHDEFPGSSVVINHQETMHSLLVLRNGDFVVVGEQKNGDPRVVPIRNSFFILKFSESGELLWSRDIEDEDINFGFQMEELPSGNVLMLGLNRYFDIVPENRSFLIEFTPKGDLVWSKIYGLESLTTTFPDFGTNIWDFRTFKIHDNHLNFIGMRWEHNQVGTKKFWFTITKMDMLGNPISDKLYAVNADSMIIGNVGVMETNDKGFLFELFIRETPRGPLQSINIHKVALVQSDFDGNIEWCKFYSRPDDEIGTLEGIQQIDSSIYITLQPSYDSHSALGFASGRGFIAQLDLEGNIKQQYQLKSVDGRSGSKNYPILEQDRSGGFMLASSGFYTKDTLDIVLNKLNGKDFSKSCILDTTDILVEPFSEFTPDTFSYDWQPYISSFDTFDIFVADVSFSSEDLCPPPILPDAIIANLREMENCPDGTKVIIDICNVGQGVLEQGLPIAIYADNPTVQNTNLLTKTTLSRDLSVDDCQQMILNTPFGAEQLFVVLNDTGSFVLPYHLGWSFPQNDKRECTYLNNMDSISLTPYRAQPVDLGDDKEICEGDGVRYQLLGSYSSVEWHDGNRTNIYDTNSSEVISVTVIDSCGAIFRDTVVVSVNPNYLIEIDTIIPKGGIYQGVSYFSDTTFTQDLMSVDGCDSIVQVSLTVDVSSVNSLILDESILLYPNPSSGVCFIDFDEATSEKYEVSFYNTLSQKVATVVISKGTKEQSVDLNHLSSGAYYYGVSSEGQLVHSGKLILLK